MTDNNLMICLLSPFMAFLIYCLYQLFKHDKSECSICGFQPSNGYYWINNQRYCDDCFKKIRECKLTEQETQYKILMRIQEERQKLIEETKLLTVDTEWDWLKKK